MTRKVIYVSYMRLSDKVSRDWYIDYLIARGITVEYWDLVPLLLGECDEVGAKITDYSRTFRTYSAVEAMLRLPENGDALYVMLINYDGYVARLFRLLRKYDCTMLFIAWGTMPANGIPEWRRVLSGFSDPLRLADRIYYRAKAIAYRKLHLVKPFDIVFAAGQALMTKHRHANKVIPINLVDYDHYSKAKLEEGRLVDGRYAVFLDTYLPYHPDYRLLGLHTVSPGDYYASLNVFFELLEMKYGIKVVIAAHPSADYCTELFNGRGIYHGRTPGLVKDADLVISHQSTSLSYAVLNRKPIIFIYTNEMLIVYKRTVVSRLFDFAGYLDAAIYNIDEITEGNQIIVKEVDPRRYDDYKYNFLTTRESEYTRTEEVFFREISKYQKEGVLG